jgi:hypothetical protein
VTDGKTQVETHTPAAAESENKVEQTARELSEFIIRLAMLPIVFLTMAPKAYVRSDTQGDYRPLPSPFLLSFVTGVALSGIIANISRFHVSGNYRVDPEFISEVGKFYNGSDGVKAVLLAVPYVAVLWIISGTISVVISRSVTSSNKIFALISTWISAAVFVEFIMVVVFIATTTNSDHSVLGGIFLLIWTCILAWLAYKVTRIIILFSANSKNGIFGAIVSLPILAAIALVLWFLGIAGLVWDDGFS